MSQRWKLMLSLLAACVPFALVAEFTIPGTFVWYSCVPTRKIFLAIDARIGTWVLCLWWLLAILAGSACYLCLSRRFPPKNLLRNYCISCEYDLTGNTSGVCPECGETRNIIIGRRGYLSWFDRRVPPRTASDADTN